MRCLSCNEPMRPYDRTRKTLSGDYVDLCGYCYSTIRNELPTVGNPTLLHEDDEEVSLFDNSTQGGLDKNDDIVYTSCIDNEDKEDNY